MCGRLACTLAPDEISSACYFKDKNNKWQRPDWLPSCYEYKPFYNGPPTTVVAALTLKEHFFKNSDYNVCLVPMHWGMLPPFKTQVTGTFHTHNARIESIRESAMYKPSLHSGKRCIVVADGYYEWQTTKGENNKQPYYVYQEENVDEDFLELKDQTKNKNLIKLAGLFNDDKTKYTCTILTKESDKSMSWMHHRMPIVLNKQKEIQDWLNYKDNPYDECLNKYVKDSVRNTLNYYVVNKQYVNKSTCNDRKCMERLSLKRTNTLDSWLKPKKLK